MTSNNELCTCKLCKTLFIYPSFGPKICPECKKEEDSQYHLVKNYIMDHTGATVQEVSFETKVSPTKIKTFLREGRLIIPDSSPIFLDCELCGTKIKFGHVCSACAATLSEKDKAELNINEFTIGERPVSGGKVKFLNSRTFED